MQPEDLQAYKSIFAQELKNILAYWMAHSVDHERGGFYGGIDQDNRPVLAAEKSCVLNARILWTFSAAAQIFPDAGYRAIADRAYSELTSRFYDPHHGGYVAMLSPDGKTADPNKHAYHHAFVLYALCCYFQLDGGKEKMRRIQEIFNLFEEKMKDRLHPGYLESFKVNWKIRYRNYVAAHNEPKTMNTHLHILEAFTALIAVWPAPQVRRRLREMLLLFLDTIIRDTGHLGVYFNNDFQESAPSQAILSFGHDIEASWLLVEAAQALGDQDLIARSADTALKMLLAVSQTGLDIDGGLFMEAYDYGRRIETGKYMWPQAEALIGFMNGFQLSGEQHYWQKVKETWDFIDRQIIDHEGGEWFKLAKHPEPAPQDGSPAGRPQNWKADAWKAPYHNGRACLEMIRRLEEIAP